MSLGAPELHVVNFLIEFNKKVQHSEAHRLRAPIGQFLNRI